MAAINGVIMQYFHWYLRAEDNLWQRVAQEAKTLANAGVTALWLPPAYKGMGGTYDVGYAAYDLYDLGDFRMGGDNKEVVTATPFSQGDRLNPKGSPKEIEAYTHYTLGSVTLLVASSVLENSRYRV